MKIEQYAENSFALDAETDMERKLLTLLWEMRIEESKPTSYLVGISRYNANSNQVRDLSVAKVVND